VTWPALLPVTFYLAIVNAIAASQIFTPSYVLTRGGPDDATLTTALYTFQTAFAYGKLGYGAAMALVVFVVVLGLTALAFRFVGRRVPYLGADS
jgi:ABC-type sugar transport system permease subunit